MKKILLFIAAAASLAGCSKGSGDDVAVPAACPVTNLVLPASGAENPIEPGTTVTIRGNGFTAGSEIWLGTSADTEVRAEVTQTTEEGIVFTAPETTGEQHVILRQEGGTWDLGTLYFGTKSSGSDEGEQENPSDEGGQEEDDTVAKPKRISQIYASLLEGTCIDFTYDEAGRLTDVDINSKAGYSSSRKIEYYQDKIYVRDLQWSEIWEYTIADGRVKESECRELEKGKTKYSLEYFYDENGYLEKRQKTDDEYFMYTYDDGSLESILSIDKWSSISHSQERVDIIPNRSVPNNLNLDFYGFLYSFYLKPESLCSGEKLLNIAGQRIKYMPEQLINIETDVTHCFEYEFDGDLVSKINFTYLYKGEPKLESSFELTYE